MEVIRKRRPFPWTALAASMLLLVVLLNFGAVEAADILREVRSRGVVRCGVSEGILGFSYKDADGRWRGLDVDFCRAVAAAVLGDPEKVKFLPLFASARFPALQSGEIDILVRNTTWTLGREAYLGALFVGTLYYDGQAFMVPRKGKVRRIADLKGATICVVKGTTSEQNLADYFKLRGMTYTPVVLDSPSEFPAALSAGKCRVCTTDASVLAAVRAQAQGVQQAFVILPDRLSKEPVGPVVLHGDERWFTLLRWILFALIEAEELGVTRENVLRLRDTSTDPAVQRLLGKIGGFGRALGVSNDWAVRAIAAVGNHGEMFERNLGSESALKLQRGLNRLWTQGGLIYAPPFR